MASTGTPSGAYTRLRCISNRQLTDNIFEAETTALAHLLCAPQESGILLTDFATAHSSVNHSWIFHVFEKAELPRFIGRFLRSIYVYSNTEVEFAEKAGGHFFMAKGVRQGCPASGFLFAKAFDPFFPWLHDKVIPHFLQPSPCAYADDFAVTAPSFRSFMAALSPAFAVIDRVPGLNLNHRKCCWVQYGSDSCHELLDWVSINCEEFRELKIVKLAKYVGTRIGPEGCLHRWITPREKCIQRAWNTFGSSKSLGATGRPSKSVLCQSLDVLDPYAHLMEQPSRRTPTLCNAPPLCGLGIDLSSALPPGLERLPTRTHSPTALQKSVQFKPTNHF